MRVKAPGKATAMSNATIDSEHGAGQPQGEAEHREHVAPTTTQLVIEPTVVGITPPRLTLSPSSVTPSETDTARQSRPDAADTGARRSVTEPPIATASMDSSKPVRSGTLSGCRRWVRIPGILSDRNKGSCICPCVYSIAYQVLSSGIVYHSTSIE